MFLNEWSDYYYRHIHGDKDTFHMAWRKLGLDYAMPARGIHSLPATMCQHDLSGERIFQHRNFDKWRTWGGNRRIPGFQHEARCFEFLAELRSMWNDLPPGVRRYHAESKSPDERAAAERISKQTWDYHRIGHDRRPIRFQPDGTIGDGSAACEIFWDIHQNGCGLILDVYGSEGRTFSATENEVGTWCGAWERFERMPIELTPIFS
jgi:hypothetical protein